MATKGWRYEKNESGNSKVHFPLTGVMFARIKCNYHQFCILLKAESAASAQ